MEAFFGVAARTRTWWRRRFASVRVPGRLEVIGRHPLVVVDGAHNVAGMIVLARSLVEEFAVDGETEAVVGMLAGPGPVGHARGPADRRRPFGGGLCPRLPPGPAGRGGGRGGARVWAWRSTVAALAGRGGRRWPSAGPGPTTGCVVCGSLYVVADARRLLVRRRRLTGRRRRRPPVDVG